MLEDLGVTREDIYPQEVKPMRSNVTLTRIKNLAKDHPQPPLRFFAGPTSIGRSVVAMTRGKPYLREEPCRYVMWDPEVTPFSPGPEAVIRGLSLFRGDLQRSYEILLGARLREVCPRTPLTSDDFATVNQYVGQRSGDVLNNRCKNHFPNFLNAHYLKNDLDSIVADVLATYEAMLQFDFILDEEGNRWRKAEDQIPQHPNPWPAPSPESPVHAK